MATFSERVLQPSPSVPMRIQRRTMFHRPWRGHHHENPWRIVTAEHDVEIEHGNTFVLMVPSNRRVILPHAEHAHGQLIIVRCVASLGVLQVWARRGETVEGLPFIAQNPGTFISDGTQWWQIDF